MKNFVRMVMLSVVAVAMSVGTVSAQQKGTFTDGRDGQKYKTVKIGNQVWMAENLRFKWDSSWCYENSTDSCAKYGRLYNWNMARKVCPKGWHLPEDDEWTELISVVGSETGGTKLKSKSGWSSRDDGSSGNGTDYYGFSALPGGECTNECTTFRYAGQDGSWWTSDNDYRGGANLYYIRTMSHDKDEVKQEFHTHSERYGSSVRCLRDK
jgi:uncharacterized protein (TIGR02145 family)